MLSLSLPDYISFIRCFEKGVEVLYTRTKPCTFSGHSYYMYRDLMDCPFIFSFFLLLTEIQLESLVFHNPKLFILVLEIALTSILRNVLYEKRMILFLAL